MGELGLPDVFWKTVFDEFLIFVLVKAHEVDEIAGFRARFEVEHHRVVLLFFHTHRKKKGGFGAHFEVEPMDAERLLLTLRGIGA